MDEVGVESIGFHGTTCNFTEHQAIRPLFFGAASEAVSKGVLGPAPIPTDDGSATTEPQAS
jgi:hypothetical protein